MRHVTDVAMPEETPKALAEATREGQTFRDGKLVDVNVCTGAVPRKDQPGSKRKARALSLAVPPRAKRWVLPVSQALSSAPTAL